MLLTRVSGLALPNKYSRNMRRGGGLDVLVDKDGTWLCKHPPPDEARRLSGADKCESPPYYVICPYCGTHWIVWGEEMNWATPVIVRVPE